VISPHATFSNSPLNCVGQSSPPLTAAAQAKIPQILIVDDEERNIRLFKAMLLSENYDLSGVFSGEDALRAVAAIRPDLILLDIMMPGIDGLQVCRLLKQNEATRAIPVIIVTALDQKQHRIKAIEVGADDFLSKPVDRTELIVRVKSLLRIKAYHDELRDRMAEIARKNRDLLELQKTKDGLTHMIVHDLRSPLSAISGKIELFLIQNGDLSKTQRGQIKSCLDSCNELADMIQSLLDIQKMKENKLHLNKQKTALRLVANEAMEQFMPKARAKQIVLTSTFSETDIAPMIDRSFIKRVIGNLIDNAIRHTSEKGKTEISIDPTPRNGSVCVAVSDNGSGLAPEFHEKIFEPFEQVALKLPGAKVGSCGLGLAFCKMAVEAHNGEIWVESAGEGTGSTFRFTLPLNQQSEQK
jgi:two-component system, sensor histidine kinase and response regulator